MRIPVRHIRRLLAVPPFYFLFCIFSIIHVVRATGGGGGDLWPLDRPEGMPSIQSLEVMCGKDHMDVHLTFSQPFEGIVSSKGQHGDPRCVYVPPSTGQTFFSFRIAYARCGTKPDLHGQFYENTVVVQYDKDLLEVWDEAKRLRCEWFNDYEKTASKPPMVIADLDVVQLDFRGDNVDCWMEIQHGKGPWAPPVSGIVPLGSTLTLVVAINDYRGEFDMRVKSCAASDGGGHVIQLSDEFGCVLRPKMISRFLKARGADERASVITYAFFHAFKFPDSLSVHIKCKVEICRHGCLDHCQLQPNKEGDVDPELLAHYVNPLERKDDRVSSGEHIMPDPLDPDLPEDILYEDVLHRDDDDETEEGPAPVKMSLNAKLGNAKRQPQFKRPDEAAVVPTEDTELDITAQPHKDIYPMPMQEKFPHGPRTFVDTVVAAPRSLDLDIPDSTATTPAETASTVGKPPKRENASAPQQTSKRKRRNVVVSDRKARSADVGVSGLYEVISEADLAFSPDSRAEAVTVFQGRIREEVVYGICMPVPGFSLLFVLVAVSAVVSALVAGSLLYRYQLQKEHLAERSHRNVPMSALSGWMGLRLLRPRSAATATSSASSSGRPTTEQNGKAGEGSVVLNGKPTETRSQE